MRRLFALIAAALAPVLVAGCSIAQAAPSVVAVAKAQISVEDAWVRSTTGANDVSMTAAYMTIVNPGDADVKLTSAQCPEAGVVQVHEMIMQDGKMIMQETDEGIAVPARDHVHLAPGGYHIMLMKLGHDFAVGDRVALTLHFSDGGTLQVEAPVKKFVQADDHSLSPTPTATASS